MRAGARPQPFQLILIEVFDHRPAYHRYPAGKRRNRDRIDAEVVETVDIREFRRPLYLPREHRFVGAAEHICHLGIRIHQALGIRDKNTPHPGCINGDLRCSLIWGENDILALRLDSSGINVNLAIQPFHVRSNTVSGHTGRIFTMEICFPASALKKGWIFPHWVFQRLLLLVYSYLFTSPIWE